MHAFTMAYVQLSHPGVDLGLRRRLLGCALVVRLGVRLLLAAGRVGLFFRARRRAQPFSA